MLKFFRRNRKRFAGIHVMGAANEWHQVRRGTCTTDACNA